MSLFLSNIASATKPPAAGGGGGEPPSGAEPTFQAAGAGAYQGFSPWVTPTPPTHDANDILIAVGMEYSGSLPAITTATSGWTKITQTNNAVATAWFWKRAAGSGTAGPTMTNAMHGCCFAVRGCITSGTPYEDATASSGNSSTMSTATITTTDIDRLAASIACTYTGVNASSGYPPSGWTNDANVLFDSLGSGQVSARYFFMSKGVGSAGDVSGLTMASLSTTTYWQTLTLAFIPPDPE